MNRPVAAVLAVVLASAGCATRGSVARVGGQVASVRVDITDLRTQQEGAGRDLVRIGADLRALDARAQELQTALRDSNAEITALRARLDAAEEEIRQTRALASTPPSPATAPGPVVEPERPREPPKPEGPEQMYNQALATYRGREHGQAVLDFTDFINQYPKHALASNARYWIGESYYAQHDYRQALAEFQKVLDVYTSSRKVPDALVKMGFCYTRLKEPLRAREAWQRVVRDYPAADAAATARSLLAKSAQAMPEGVSPRAR